MLGSSSERDWNPSFFMDYDVIFVSVQYRLGSLGFLALTQNKDIAGNF